MRVLVTGAAGFIGSHLVHALAERGDDVVAVDCLLAESYDPAVKQRAFDSLAALGTVTPVLADLRSVDLAPLLEGIDVVVNEAGLPGLNLDRHGTQLYTSCNVDVVSRLVSAAQAEGVTRFVQVSSSSVYGERAVGDESMPTRPCSPYGESKLAAERVVAQACARQGFPGVVLRYFSVYGPGQRPDMAYHRFCEALLGGQPLTVFGDGRQSRSNTYVTDVVAATILAVDDAPAGEVLNVAGGESITLLDAIAVLADELAVEPRLHFGEPRDGDQRQTRGDASRAARVLTWSPQMTAHDGLRSQARWHASQH